MATEVLLAGWGQKEGSRRKNWKRRYFILRTAHPDESRASGCTHTLVYYKTEEDATGLRSVSHSQMLIVKSADAVRCLHPRRGICVGILSVLITNGLYHLRFQGGVSGCTCRRGAAN